MKSVLISKIRCYSPNKKSSASRNANYIKYIATREGVDLTQELSEETINAEIKYIKDSPGVKATYMKDELFSSKSYNDINTLSQEIFELTKDKKLYSMGL